MQIVLQTQTKYTSLFTPVIEIGLYTNAFQKFSLNLVDVLYIGNII